MRILIQSWVDLWLFICFNVTIRWVLGLFWFFWQFMNYKIMNKGYSWNRLWSKENWRTWLSSPAGGGIVWSGLCWWASAVIDTGSLILTPRLKWLLAKWLSPPKGVSHDTDSKLCGHLTRQNCTRVSTLMKF